MPFFLCLLFNPNNCLQQCYHQRRGNARCYTLDVEFSPTFHATGYLGPAGAGATLCPDDHAVIGKACVKSVSTAAAAYEDALLECGDNSTVYSPIDDVQGLVLGNVLSNKVRKLVYRKRP